MLWNSVLLLSAAYKKLRMASEDTPSFSGVLMGRDWGFCAVDVMFINSNNDRAARESFLKYIISKLILRL